jgi:hypothetical protein
MTEKKVRVKRDFTKEGPIDIEEKLINYIKLHELFWWTRGFTSRQIRNDIQAETEFKLKRSDWPRIVFWHCEIIGKWKLKATSGVTHYDDKQWDKLRIAVEQMKPYLQSLCCDSIEHAVKIMRSKIATSRTLLEGLPKRMHYWDTDIKSISKWHWN